MPPMAPARRNQGERTRAPRPMVPFTAAAHLHTELCNLDAGIVLGAAQQQRAPIEVPAYGFMRHILLEVSGAGGVLGAGVLGPDWPFNILQNIQLLDTNGAPIFGPLDGYSLYLINKYGGYGYRQDPKLDSGYDATINPRFFLRVPVEITRHNGYGALANQNAANSYKLQYTINLVTASANGLFSTAPTTPPTMTVRAHLEAWSQPAPTDLAQRPQQREPLGHGTTQFWTGFTKPVVAGQNNLLFTRVGNAIRGWILIGRLATGVRSDTVFPDPFLLQWDARNLTGETQAARIKLQEEAVQSPSARDSGVFAFMFNNLLLGHGGDEEPNLWLPTVQASRIELQGVAAAAGTIQITTNDIAPAEIDPSERYVETSVTGFHPAVGQPVPQAA